MNTAKGPQNQTPLHIAAYIAHKDANVAVAAVERAIVDGAPLEAQTADTHETALHLACNYSRVTVAAHMLDRGADSNAQDKDGNTPLHKAVAVNCHQIVDLLRRQATCHMDVKVRPF